MVKEDKDILKSMIGNIPNEDNLIQVVIKKIKIKGSYITTKYREK